LRKYIMDGEFDKLKGCVGQRESGSQSFDQHLTELFKQADHRRHRGQAPRHQRRRPHPGPPRISNSDTKLK